MVQSVLTRPSRPTPPPRTPAPKGKRRHGQGAAYLFLSPWIIGAALLTIGPMMASLYLSFTDYDLFSPPQWVGVDNYVAMFTGDDRFWHAAGVTAKYVLISVPVKLGLALAVAMLLNRPRRGVGLYRSAFYAPSLLGASVSVALAWRAMFSTDGTVDRVLGAVGLDLGGWVDNPDLALLTLVALAVWQFGAPMVIFLAGLKQVPPELYEAAEIDGAGPVRRFISVTMPLLTPVILFNLVLETIHAFQAFTGAFVVSSGRGGPSDSTLLYTLYLYQRGFSDFRMGYASAMAWVLLVVVAIITALVFRSARRWVFYAGEGR
ncbi:carbohydrate ABC transporter permease [Lentzea flaviverrucosa]|uniref:Multiple sugar transport system permease protein n=1 Tax=Lentzea flaviverrucosa TaxID=200379 RepID=A0A1H9XX98_9PSEU|nr:sugar ABC transporter permease [Lentzea flaviverrucosa]RDI34442.1 carbohydrate ABC transporter membrane protein 1 (CUT1 family) [Lentzea flaviverrucosa]SES50387.1 multiple sugar transport system permease protein [Lentzea flaviverrucosa]